MAGQSDALIAVAMLIGVFAKSVDDDGLLDKFPDDVLQWMKSQASALVPVIDDIKDMDALMTQEMRRLIASVDPSWSSTHEPA